MVSTMRFPEPISLPPDSEASRQRRAMLSRDWWQQAKVMAQLSIEGATLQDWRKQRSVIAVWHAPMQAYLYPPFQFHDHRLAPQIAPLLQSLESLACPGGWGEIEWLYGPHALLAGRSPAEAFSDGPDRVLAVAYREFIEEREANQ